MDRSAELRWFWRESAPGPLAAWFDDAGAAPETRTDLYLVLADTDALGIKTRGGTTNLELKLRSRPGEPLAVPSGSRGQLEEWQKWSLSRAGITRFLPRLGLPRERWLAVAKRRRTAAMPYRGDAGCNVELATVEAAGQSWTTLGFEANGPPAELVPALRHAVETFFASVAVPPELNGARSCGYPGWLAML